jgi:hypothetical protein
MKTVALLSTILLAAACATSDSKLIKERTIPCAEGQPIDILGGLNAPSSNDRLGTMEDRATLVVNVANNSNDDQTVVLVTAEQVDSRAGYTLDRAYGKYDQTIAPGEEHTFELAMMVQRRPTRLDPPNVTGDRGRSVSSGADAAIVLAVKVSLSNGDSYLCRFVVGAS